jgi:arylsulfatase
MIGMLHRRLIIFLLFLLFAAIEACDSPKAEVPNVILILVDDMGYGDLSCYGASLYKTPNLDKMAARGMRFTNFLAANPVCSASRAGLLTGCYPNRVGIRGALMPDAKVGLNPSEETLAEVLKKRDYRTCAVGKWHLGRQEQFLPLQHGFDEYLGLPYSNDMWPMDFDGKPAAPDKSKARHPHLPLIAGNEVIREIKTLDDQAQLTTMYTEKAATFIKENRDHPFFIYLAHSMPHVPLAVSSKFKGKSQQGLYGDVMMEIDWSLGEILKALKKNGLDKNTLIIFTSDNGPWLNFGNHAGSAGGLREGKRTTFEGGQRVPCLMQWPEQIAPGTICNRLVSAIDLLPTLAEISGAPLPEQKIDGVSILPLLQGDQGINPRNTFLYYMKGNDLEAVRKDNWKLVFAHKGLSYEGFKPGEDGFSGAVNKDYPFEKALYDLRRDPGERYNLLKYYPEIVTELENIANGARSDLGDNLQQIPGQNLREPGRVE